MILDKLSQSGLSYIDVEQRKADGKVNVSHDNISKSKKQIVLEHTFTYFNLLNCFLAIIIISTGRWKNLTFMVVIIVNAVMGIFQELKVKKIIDQLSVVTEKKVKVIRDSLRQVIPVEELVLDDMIYLESGNQVTTDCIVLESHALEVNESLLTGEAHPIQKNENDELLAGSFIVAGSAYAKVIRVGIDNYSTQLVHKAKHKNKASSEMKDAILKVIKILSIVIIPVGFVLFYSQMNAYPDDYSTAIVKTVAGVVGMIPEGLVLLTSISFVLGVGKLAKKKALIQEMEAIEALARVNVLCLDKTGTLTTGQQIVKELICFPSFQKEDVEKIMGAMAYSFDDVNLTQKALQDYFHHSPSYQVDDIIPFSSERKYRAAKFHELGSYALGAPEFLTHDQDMIQLADEYFNLGLRVLMLVSVDELNSSLLTIEGIHPMAFIIISDCIRDDAKETLDYFDHQGVDIRILSGDSPVTVSRIAQLAGMRNGDRYIDASTLPHDQDELQKVVSHYHVFGRVKPEQKQMIIKALQKEGYIVGMVGDGVNDVLAIKDADCGIAMAAGSDAAKQAAHIVLLDSNFGSMKDIVEEGKTIIADIERVSSLYLTKTIYSTLLSLIFAGLSLSYPFTPLQLSLISGLAIGIPSFCLTLEQSSSQLSDGFLKHVISIALPCALTMIIYMLGITFLGYLLNFDAIMLSTYYYLVAAFISFLVVFIVCIPFTKIRFLMWLSVTILFYSIVLLIPDFFGIYHFIDLRVIWVVPICISSIFVLKSIKKIIDNIYHLYENNYKGSK